MRFGSRVDVWVPKEAEIRVKLGDNVKGGSSVLAMWPVKMDSAQRSNEIAGSLTTAGKQD